MGLSPMTQGGCATATRGGSGTISELPATSSSSPGRIRDEDTLPPSLLDFRSQLQSRLVAAHRRLGRGRPATTEATLGELGPGGSQSFTTRLSQGRCYTFVVVGATDDQEIDLLLATEAGMELAQDVTPGSEASVELCPTSDGAFVVEVRMYRGSGPFALQLFGS